MWEVMVANRTYTNGSPGPMTVGNPLLPRPRTLVPWACSNNRVLTPLTGACSEGLGRHACTDAVATADTPLPAARAFPTVPKVMINGVVLQREDRGRLSGSNHRHLLPTPMPRHASTAPRPEVLSGFNPLRTTRQKAIELSGLFYFNLSFHVP